MTVAKANDGSVILFGLYIRDPWDFNELLMYANRAVRQDAPRCACDEAISLIQLVLPHNTLILYYATWDGKQVLLSLVDATLRAHS